MGYQATFKRYEIKYLLNGREKAEVLGAMELYMRPDEYGRTTIQGLWLEWDIWDTPVSAQLSSAR